MNQENQFSTPAADLSRVAARTWDVAVIGAGPAGALAAYELARQGTSVLLVEKSNFPRPKVCGCCLNMSALAALERAGLGELPARRGARPLKRVEIHLRSGKATLPLPGGVSLSRAAFDAALADEAVQAGATFLTHTKAVLDPRGGDSRCLHLQSETERADVQARLVIAADGLAGTALARLPEFATTVSDESHIGAGVTLDDATGFEQDGTIFMACGHGGYVGAVILEDGRLNLAAALDRRATRSGVGVAELAAGILREARLPVPADITRQPWRGTPALTRKRRRLAGERIFVLGDAAGYVEPFTGEGMAWALQSAGVLATLVIEALQDYNDEFAERWTRSYHHLIGRRQRTCRAVSALLRTPWMARGALSILAPMPWLARPWVRGVNTPPASSSLRTFT